MNAEFEMNYSTAVAGAADFVPSENTILELFTLPFSRIFVFKNKRKIGTRLPGGGTSLYKPYRYVPPHRVGFLRRFGLKTGVVFEGTTGINVFIVSIPNEYQSINQFNRPFFTYNKLGRKSQQTL